jgi:hypothetical protein
MKSILALGCISACALLVGCDDGTSVTTIESSQIRPPAAQPVEPPSAPSISTSNNAGQDGTAAPKPGN